MTGRRRAVAATTALLLAAGAAWYALAWRERESERQLGADLFEGRRPLAARIQGHDEPLPPEAARCINCHRRDGALPAAQGDFGPALSAATLQDLRARRGGPPSRYDAASLCRLLRTGIDAAFVTVPRAMPRYDASDADCAALWAHLINA